MRKIFFLVGILLAVISATAQTKQHKIVYDLNDGDTAAHSAVIRQFNNILRVAPDAELELVCHGPAIFMMVKSKVFFEEKMKELKVKGAVRFTVCANSMKRLQVDPSQLIAVAEIVPVAILELSARQMDGWSYIKAGR